MQSIFCQKCSAFNAEHFLPGGAAPATLGWEPRVDRRDGGQKMDWTKRQAGCRAYGDSIASGHSEQIVPKCRADTRATTRWLNVATRRTPTRPDGTDTHLAISEAHVGRAGIFRCRGSRAR
jgi:hypothetical protein